MTKATVKEGAVPVVVVLGILAITAQALGLLPGVGLGSADVRALENRLTAAEARQVDFERMWREDRKEMNSALYQIQGDLREIKGKIDSK